MLMIRACSKGKWLEYRVKKFGYLNPLSEKQLTCIAVISKFIWYGFLVFLMRKLDTVV